MVNAGIDFELELDLKDNRLRGRIGDGATISEPLLGQPAAALAAVIEDFLVGHGLDRRFVPATAYPSDPNTAEYSAEVAQRLADAWRAVTAALAAFRAGIREETSPIQLWPHHFDLAMLWLPGEQIPGEDPGDEESADKQMNFGFTLGDDSIPEPYFYVTAYPLPEALPGLQLPAGTIWQTEGFNGAVLRYRSLVESADPSDYLLHLWNLLLAAGRQHLLERAD